MISVKIEKAGAAYKTLSCLGHANYAESGKDIVCAAASVLVINTLNAIEQLTDTPVSVVSNKKNGQLVASFPNEPDERATLLLDALGLGLCEIERQYGKRFIKYEEVQLC